MSGNRVLCFPERPAEQAVITKICRAAGCAITANPDDPVDLAIAWDTNTVRAEAPALVRLARDMPVWNHRCRDIGKATVDRAFVRAFGYSSVVDPLNHAGPCVSKSNLNAAHDGKVITCPIAAPDPGRVYQRVVGNEALPGLVEDIRTPLFGGEVPFVFLNYRPLESRFDQFETHVAIEESHVVFTADERTRIAEFARELGMDYGELDVLRDRADGRLYIVDANPTPFGPPNRLSESAQQAAIDRLADAFDRCRRRTPATAVRHLAGDGGPSVPHQAAPVISVVVVARNEGRLVHDTVSQLNDTLPEPNEILVVDDGSDDGSTEGLTAAFPRVNLIRGNGLGVARGRNLGASRSRGRVIVFADAHLTIPANWWQPLLDAVSDPRVGGAAPGIINSGSPWQRGYGLRFVGFDLGVEWLDRRGDEPYAVPLMPWCFGAMRRDVFDATGGFDSGMIQWGSIDNEMSVRLWSLGYELKIVPGVDVGHVFRNERPYPIEWTPVLHNTLRLACVHFGTDRIARVVRAIGDHPDFPAAIARVVAGDVSARRGEMTSRRVRDAEWLFRDLDASL